MTATQRQATYTTGEVARLCQVTKRTVIKWIDGGRLTGYTIPGSRHRRVTAESLQKFMRSNGIPDHATGDFPNAHNPNRIRAQNYNYRVPLAPKAAAAPTALGMYPWGVALNGIPFDPLAMEFWNLRSYSPSIARATITITAPIVTCTQ